MTIAPIAPIAHAAWLRECARAARLPRGRRRDLAYYHADLRYAAARRAEREATAAA